MIPSPFKQPLLPSQRSSLSWFWSALVLLLGLYAMMPSCEAQNINRKMANRLMAQLQTSKPDTNRFNTLLELGRFHIYKPGDVKADLDSALDYLTQAKALSTAQHWTQMRHRAETMLVVAHMEAKDTLLGQSLFKQLMAGCKRTGDKVEEADALSRFGACLIFTTKNFPAVFSCYHQAAHLYRALGYPEKEIQMFREIASIHTNQGELELGKKEFLMVLNRYKAIHFPFLHYTYSWLSYINRLQGHYDTALLYGFQCVETMNKTRDTVLAPIFYGNIAQVYLEIGNQPQCIRWYTKALQQWRQEKQADFAMYNVASIIARDMTMHHKAPEAIRLLTGLVQEIPPINKIQKGCIAQSMATCFEAMRQYALAERYYLEAIDWFEKSHKNFEMSQKVQHEVGRFYLERKDYKKARFYLQKLLDFVPRKTPLVTIKDAHFLLFKVDSAQGNYVAAIDHFSLYKTLNDSLFNETKSKQIAQLELQYEAKENQRNIAFLKKQSTLQTSELRQTRIIRNGMVVGSLLLLLLLGLSYNRFRLKQRSTHLLEIKQQEINEKNEVLQQTLREQDHLLAEKEQLLVDKEWMLKEIHHRVKNNLQIITSLLHTQGIYLKDQNALSTIQESQNRIHVMALIHQKLYQSDHLTTIPMDEYISEIVDYLLATFNRQGDVHTQITVAPIQVDVTLAVPLGLIINEVITNSLKYAFPAEYVGLIKVELTESQCHVCQLTITDNGIGLPADFNPARSRTLGMSLIRGLSKQIGGKLEISQHNGVQVQLAFSVEQVGQQDLVKL